VPVPAYQWAATIVPSGWATLGDVGAALGLGPHQSRRVVLAARVPWRMFRRCWRDPATGMLFGRKAIGLPPSSLHLLVMIRLERILQRFPERRPMGARWRQQKRRARQRYPTSALRRSAGSSESVAL
jgi:hypothetical protein